MPDRSGEHSDEEPGNGVEGGSLDITMSWDDAPVSGSRRSATDDSVWFSRESSGPSPPGDDAAGHSFAFNMLNNAVQSAMERHGDTGTSAALQLLEAEAHRPCVEGDFSDDEEFQWTRERNQAVEDALRITQETPFTAIYHQLTRIAGALAAGNLSGNTALRLLDEADRYLDNRIMQRQGALTGDTVFEEIRDHVRDGLVLFREASAALREYLKEPAPLHLDLVARLCDEANEFIREALGNLTVMYNPASVDSPRSA